MAVLLITATSATANGQPEPSPVSSPAWANGVPKENQARANFIFAEGNQLFAQQAHTPALMKYREAIELWDHPMIRFNMAVTLVRLDRVLEAAAELERALRFGDAPFSSDLYQQALDYQRLLRGRLGVIRVRCTQSAKLILDGKPWSSCPGASEATVLSGEHLIVAEAPGYLTLSKRVVVAGGGSVNESLTFVPIASAVALEYPVRVWIPWSVVAGGAAVGLGGLGMWILGNNQIDEFETEYSNTCPRGCDASLATTQRLQLLSEKRQGAIVKGNVGVAMMATGAAAAAGGLVWVLINRPRQLTPTVEAAPLGAGGMSIALRGTF